MSHTVAHSSKNAGYEMRSVRNMTWGERNGVGNGLVLYQATHSEVLLYDDICVAC